MSRLRATTRRTLSRVLDRARVRYPVAVAPPEAGARGVAAVVLGSSGGLGGSVARTVLDAGADVVWGLDRTEPDDPSPGVHHRTTDLTAPAQVDEAVATLRAALGPERRLIWLLGCAGTIGDHRPGLGADPATWLEVYANHVVGPVQLALGLVPAMAVGSSITLVTSVNAQTASPWPHYAASKAAQEKAVEDLAARLAHDGIRVNGVAPSRFRPQPEVRPGESPLHGADVPQEAVVGAMLFLADSARSPATTGVNLRIDGGLAVWHDRLDRPPD